MLALLATIVMGASLPPAKPIVIVNPSVPAPPKTDTCHLYKDSCWSE